MKIGLLTTGRRIDPVTKEKIDAAMQNAGVDAVFHPLSFVGEGHFAGSDAQRTQALLDFANDPSFDAIWFVRGSTGSYRIMEAALAGLNDVGRSKLYIGYSDIGFLMANFYRAGVGRIVHGPMPISVRQEGGEKAINRVLDYIRAGDKAGIEPSCFSGQPHIALNLSVLNNLVATPFLPNLQDHVVMVEETHEYMYAIDRMLFHITSSPALKGIAGLRLGRVSNVPENTFAFGETEEEIAQKWCKLNGIPYLGRADIGHDSDNKIVPFGIYKP